MRGHRTNERERKLLLSVSAWATGVLVIGVTLAAHSEIGGFHAEAANINSTFTVWQRERLNQFGVLVKPHLQNCSEFMNSDWYLNAWLNESDYNVKTASAQLLETLKWRNETDIAASTHEDFTRFDRGRQVNIDGVDRAGRPVLIVPLGAWSPRQASVGGQKQLEKYRRFLVGQVHERALQKLEEFYEAAGSGKNISQVILIIDVQGFNAREHGCIRCLPVLSGLISSGERHYPGLVHKAFFINTPRTYDDIIRILRSQLGPSGSAGNYQLHDHDRDKWQAAIREYVDPAQLPAAYGGTKSNGHRSRP